MGLLIRFVEGGKKIVFAVMISSCRKISGVSHVDQAFCEEFTATAIRLLCVIYHDGIDEAATCFAAGHFRNMCQEVLVSSITHVIFEYREIAYCR